MTQSTFADIAREIRKTITQHDEYIKKCLCFGAGEWVLSPLARAAMSSLFYGRACGGERSVENPFKPLNRTGTVYMEEIDSIAVSLLQKLFDARFIEYRCATVTTANNVTLSAISEPQETILALAPPIGHRDWATVDGFPGHRDQKIINMPFDEYLNVDVDAYADLMERFRPKAIVVGSAVTLFPYPIGAMKEIADEIGAKIMCDGAYLLGPVAGRLFPNPLNEGASVVTGSTCKTLCGPKAGLILYNDPVLHKKIRSVIGAYVGGYNHARIAAMAITIAEISEFGRDFFTQTQVNAKTLAQALDSEGFDIVAKKKGYTSSNMIAMNASGLGGGNIVARELEKVNILCDMVKLGRQEGYDGITLGLSVVTRLGMKEKEMNEIAEFIRRTIIDKENPEKIKSQVEFLRSSFDKVHYCFSQSINDKYLKM